MFKPKVKYEYDLVVIGSGAGGSVGAHYANSIGKKVAIVERHHIGGECPNIGCVPTKALLHAAEVYETVKTAGDFGITAKDVSFDYTKIHAWKDLTVSRTGATHGEESLSSDGMTVIKGHARFVDAHTIDVQGREITAARFIIATGSTVFVPPITGLKEAGYITFEEAIDYTSPPASIFILGGGPIGCEFAQVFSTFGTKVTIADTLPKLIAKEDAEVSDLVAALFENRGMQVLTGISVSRVEKKGSKKVIYYLQNGVEKSTEAHEILVATGKRPVLDLDVEKAGISLDKGRLNVNKYLQTNVPHIFASGDVAGPWLFTHTGYYQSYTAAHNAFARDKVAVDYTVVPRCVFTRPEVASVGLSEMQARQMGMKLRIGMAPIQILGRANTSNEFDGFVKVITDRNDVILGGAIVAPRAGEMIHEIALAVRLKAKAGILASMLHAYPTFSEAIKIACSSLETK